MQETGGPRRISRTDRAGSGEFEVPSDSTPGRSHYPRVRVVAERLSPWCACPGFRFRGRCRHADAAVALVTAERRAAALRVVGRALRDEVDVAS